MAERECGGCQACCFVLPVYPDSDRSKIPMTAERETCTYQCDAGCLIYKDRPGPCKTYRCMWLLGWAHEEYDRPDKLGVAFEADARMPGFIAGYETRPGGFEGERAQIRMGQLREQADLMVVTTLDGEDNQIEV